MILISNSQRDEIVRYLRLYGDSTGGGGTRAYNARRLARNLARKLEGKKPFNRSLLPERLKNWR